MKSEHDPEISDAVWETFVGYPDRHTEVSVCGKDGLEGRPRVQFENGKCILYDEQFYYLPDELMRDICRALTRYTGYIFIKDALYRDGILLCNSNMHRNYTVKKVFYDAFGRMFRKRVLILKKELFVPWGSPTPEERRNGNNEISGKE